jgi:hypothetical protein
MSEKLNEQRFAGLEWTGSWGLINRLTFLFAEGRNLIRSPPLNTYMDGRGDTQYLWPKDLEVRKFDFEIRKLADNDFYLCGIRLYQKGR